MSGTTPAELLDMALSGNLDLNSDEIKTTGQQSNEGEQQVETKKEEPAAAPAAPAQGEGQKQKQQEEAPGTPIASKSGSYQIPFERLQEARDQRAAALAENGNLKAENERLAQQVANLQQAQADAQQRAAAGVAPTEADKNLDAANKALKAGAPLELFGDFSEEALAAGIDKLVNARLEERLTPIRQEQETLKKGAVQTAEQKHYAAITTAHPDASELMESSQFESWKAGLPSFMRQSVDKALDQGTTQEIIEVFDTFKKASGQAPAAPAGKGTAAKAPEVQAHVPHSLSEMAGDVVTEPGAALLAKADNPAALLNAFDGMSREQVSATLDRVV